MDKVSRARLHRALDQVLDLKRATDQAAGLEKRTYEIEASPEVLDRLEDFMLHVQWCAGVGHSCTVGMDIDGDGPERFYVKAPGIADIKVKAANRRGEFETARR